MPRYALRFKAKNVGSRSRQGGDVTYIYTADDIKAQAAAADLEGLTNAKITSITKQILDEDDGDYPDATANGGSASKRILCRNSDRVADSIYLPFIKDSVGRQAIEAVIENPAHGLLNQSGGPLGQYVSAKEVEIIDGAA